jgi:Tol biopolymer transport system component
MGEVYRARDSRLERDVAIKVLPAQLARDPDALARFEREALSVARLSHPNILAIYELGNQNGTTFVVTELVDGETLRDKLGHGALNPRRAVGYAQQIARGIAAAHARGIVHRDLKPENVMVTRDDHVKILDFGLAKPIVPRQSDETRAAQVQTNTGTVLGTFAYMAPEQVRGLDVDHRADVFAFGAVLYEMLSGDRPFKGETAADTMTAVLSKDPPDLDLDRLAISAGLDRIVRRCLEKAPELRFQSADDLAFALESLATASSSTTAKASVLAPRRRLPAWLPWVMAGLAIAAAGVASGLRRVPGPEMWQRFTEITEAAGEEDAPAISPDGSTVLYNMRVNGRWGIYAQRVGGRNATPIIVDPQRDVGSASYAPDGGSIAYHEVSAAGGIFVAGATGESVRRVTDFGFDPAWSPDSKTLAFVTEAVHDPASRQSASLLYLVDAAGGTPRQLAVDDAMQPVFSPSGVRLAFWSNVRGQRDLYTVSVAGGAAIPVTNDVAIDWSPAWSPDGRYVYFSSDRGGAMNLWRIAVDERSGQVRGEAEPVTNGVQAGASWPRFSKDGSRLVFRSRVKAINPVAIPFDPVTARAGVPKVLDGSNNIRVPSDVSPDGKEIAYFSIGERQEDAFIGPIDGSRIRRLTDDLVRDRAPMFTRDGKSVVFYSNRNGNWEVWLMRTDGSALRKVASYPHGCVYALASPTDDTLVFSSGSDASGTFLVRPSGSGFTVPEPLPNETQAGGAFNAFGFSPDGTKLAGLVRLPNGHSAGVAVYDLRSHVLSVVADDPVNAAHWLPDNRRVLYFTNEGRDLVMVDSVTRARTVVDVPLPGRATDDVFAVSRDGRTIYYGAERSEADIWIAEKK